jgi:DNA-binding MarR family transcriptional regulator
MQEFRGHRHASDWYRPAARVGSGGESEDALRSYIRWPRPRAGWDSAAEPADRIGPEESLSSTGNLRSLADSPAEAVTDAVLTASRLLVGVSARSIAAIDESLTIPQFRMLVVLYAFGPLKPSSAAEILHVNPSNATRMVHRLITANLVERRTNPEVRREALIELTEAGEQTVAQVTMQRHRHIADIVERMSERDRTYLVEALEAFNVAGGESPATGIPDDWI